MKKNYFYCLFSLILIVFFFSSSAFALVIQGESYHAKSATAQNYGTVVGSLSSGDWLQFSGVVFNNESLIRAHLSSGAGGGTVEFRLGTITGTLIASLTIRDTKDWNTYVDFPTTLVPTVGTYDVFVVFKNNQYGVCNFDWFEIGNFPPSSTTKMEHMVYLPYDKVTLNVLNPFSASIKSRSWQVIQGTANIAGQGDTVLVSGLKSGVTIVRYSATNLQDLTTTLDITITAKFLPESPARSTDPARVKVIKTTKGSTIATADGQRLRGVPMAYLTSVLNDPFDNIVFNANFYKKAHNMGFNAVKCFAENPDLNDEAALMTSLSICDSIVNLTSKYGLQLLLNAGNIAYYQNPNPAELKRRIEYNQIFNGILANRYKNRTHVIFEQQNEPIYNILTPYPTVIQDIANCYTLMRKVAPDSHITLFSLMMSCGYSMLDMAKSLDAKVNVDWTKTTFGYHTYGCNNNTEILELEAEYPVVQTEFWPERDMKDGNSFGTPYETEGLEKEEISWFIWWKQDGNKDLSIYDAMLAELKSKGLMWNFTPIDLQEPVVTLGNDTTLYLPNNSITLTGKATDPNGSITKYNWVLMRKTGQADFISNGNIATLTNMTKGTVYLRLYAWDNEGNYTYDDIQVVAANIQQIPGQINAVDFSASYGVEGNYTLGWIQIGDWAEYKTNVAQDGLYSIEVNVAAEGTGGLGRFFMDGAPLSSIFVAPGTGGWNTWKSVYCSAYLTAGFHTIRYECIKNGYDLNYYTFTKTNASIDISSAQTLNLPVDNTTLTVTASDPSGIKSYLWEKASGPTGAVLSGADQSMVSLSKLTAGEYIFKATVTMNDNSIVSKDVKVTVIACDDNPTVTAGPDKKFEYPKNYVDISIVATSGSGIASYKWEKISGPAAGTMTNANTETLSLTNLEVGFYTFRITVISNKGCVASDDIMVKVFAPTGINRLDSNETLKIFPNPAHDKLNLTFEDNCFFESTINLIDITGETIKIWNTHTNELTLDIHDVPKGLYFISIRNENNKHVRKVIIQ